VVERAHLPLGWRAGPARRRAQRITVQDARGDLRVGNALEESGLAQIRRLEAQRASDGTVAVSLLAVAVSAVGRVEHRAARHACGVAVRARRRRMWTAARRRNDARQDGCQSEGAPARARDRASAHAGVVRPPCQTRSPGTGVGDPGSFARLTISRASLAILRSRRPADCRRGEHPRLARCLLRKETGEGHVMSGADDDCMPGWGT